MRLVETCRSPAFAALVFAAPVTAQTLEPEQRARMLIRFSEANEIQLRDIAGFVRVIRKTAPISRLATSTPALHRRRNTVSRADARLTGAELPVIEVRVPQNAVVAVSGAVRLHMAPAQAARIRLDACGDADIVHVEGEANVVVSGSQALRLYEAGQAEIVIAGSGDVTLGAVHNGLTVSVAGSGDVDATRVDGPTSIAVQGFGDVTIRDGRATSLSVVIAGGGDVVHNGAADSLDAVILGGGDARVRRVEGEINRSVLGGGEVVVGS